MKRSMIASILTIGFTGSMASAEINGLYHHGYTAYDELVYSYQFALDGSTRAENLVQQSFVDVGVEYLVDAYVNGFMMADFLWASDCCYYAYAFFYASGLVDQAAFNRAYQSGQGIFGNLGDSDFTTWCAAWLAWYASNDYYMHWWHSYNGSSGFPFAFYFEEMDLSTEQYFPDLDFFDFDFGFF